MPITKLIRKLSGDPYKKIVKTYQKRVDAINAKEVDYQALSDEQLKAKTQEFKLALAKGKTLDDILVDAFACVRETSVRVLQMRHFDVQLIGGMVLHEGRIAEMKTGEGKTLVSTLSAYLNALEGKGVYVVTVNDYLAKRDSEWMGQIYSFLGLSVGLIQGDMDPQVRLEAYKADITYGTNNEFGFDYLRDNLAQDLSQCCQLRRHYAIIDEVDSILIDEARTPLIISGPVKDSTAKYVQVAKVIKGLSRDKHFTVEEKHKNIVLTEAGIEAVEKAMNLEDIYSIQNMDVAHMAVQCLKALYLFAKDVDYVVNGGNVVIVDEFTGRLMEGRRFSDGLHQAIEAIEGVIIREESQTLASVTFQNYFRMFPKLSGMTGTAQTEAAEFLSIYGLPVTAMPTNKPLLRDDKADVIYKTKQAKYNAIVDEIKKYYDKGQPVLVGTIAIETSELLSSTLKKKGVIHHVLNAKHHEKEAEIIANAGQKKAVTIATNMAGRGTDIVLGEGVLDLGGLAVIGSERHESRRIDNQLRGRAGRQGDPGESCFFVSLEDELMKLFGSDRIKSVMERLGMPDDMPIQHAMISKSMQTAQTKVEKYHYGIRKQILKYDDVLNKQRETIYRLRYEILSAKACDQLYANFVVSVLKQLDREFLVESLVDVDTKKEFCLRVQQFFPVENVDELLPFITKQKNYDPLKKALIEFYLQRRAQYPEGLFDVLVTRRVMLITLDQKWMDHLHDIDTLREGIGLRAFGQRDPLTEYKREGFDMFQALVAHFSEEAITIINKAVLVQQDGDTPLSENQGDDGIIDLSEIQTNKKPVENQVSQSRKIGRNERVTIMKDGVKKELKWKQAELLVKDEGWQII